MTMVRFPLALGSVYAFEELRGSKYVVAGELRGGMGVVYKLIPVDPTDPPVALKTLQGSTDINAFIRECEIWTAASEHPNIAKPYWFGEYHGRPAIIAEWYPAALSDAGLYPFQGA
ncbi:MAG: hypothetical protein HY872_09740 [Chloroflexi bacterium]|nr:hypothetical protein [Chloroflexota bacterium]